MGRHRRLLLILTGIIGTVVVFAKCMDFKEAPPATAQTIAGAASCKQCHAAIVDAYEDNAHRHTSHPIEDGKLIAGPLPQQAEFVFDAHLKVIVEQRDSGMYQVAYVDGRESMARRFDVAIGSGVKAYTYGSWQGRELKEMPLSYFRSIRSWANSPGFPKNNVYFDRSIGLRCLECHSSFADHQLIPDGGLKVKEELIGSTIVYGIDCERCHGPAGKHVEFHLDHPREKRAQFIAIYKTLSRTQKIDACAVCHAGADPQMQSSTFSFKPGDQLKAFHSPMFYREVKDPDVHGNQSRLLEKSQCFIQSKTLECGSCHRTHENLKGNLTAFSQKCISCHALPTIKHSAATLSNAMVKTNCIDCHMPRQASNLISFQLAGQGRTAPYLLRTHKIAVYRSQ